MPTREQFKAQARAVRRMAAATREVDAAQIAQRREPSTTNKRRLGEALREYEAAEK